VEYELKAYRKDANKTAMGWLYLRVGASSAGGHNADGRHDLGLGDVRVEVEVRRRLVAKAEQSDSRLSADVQPVDE